MAVIPFQRRNTLAYPAGSAPGFDPNHVAAQNCGFSGVASNGGTFANVLSRVKGTEGGTKTTSLYGPLGPVTNYISNGTNVDSTVFPYVTAASHTQAGILKFAAIPPTTGYILNTSAAGSVGIGDVFGLGTFTITNVINIDTSVAYVVGSPYFFAASLNGATVNWVIVRLDSGQVWSGAAANANAIGGDGTITVGSRGTAARQINGGIAAAMASNAFMSQQQLLQWAKDPWAFWYPNRASNRVAAAAASGFLAAWANQSNLPVIGTGTY